MPNPLNTFGDNSVLMESLADHGVRFPGRKFDFDEHWRRADDVLIGRTTVKVASIPTLLALLAGSDNPKHEADITLLRRVLAGR